jgi:hypothetical protein
MDENVVHNALLRVLIGNCTCCATFAAGRGYIRDTHAREKLRTNRKLTLLWVVMNMVSSTQTRVYARVTLHVAVFVEPC